VSKLQVAVIGVGGIARTHMPGCEVVADSDINEAVLEKWGQVGGEVRVEGECSSP
jgi:predicted dehydrogenase